MFDKLNQAKQKAEEIKQRLETISVDGEAAKGKVKVVATANRKITSIEIADELITLERKEELQDLILIAIENALSKAENVSETEMRSMMMGMLPGGLGNLFGK